MADRLGESYSFEPSKSRRATQLDERAKVSYSVSIDGVDLRNIGISDTVGTISIDDSIGDMVKVCVVLAIEDRSLLNEGMFRVGNALFVGIKMREEHDVFYTIIKSHRIDYYGGKLYLVGIGSEIILHESEKRRQWKNTTSAAICTKIAEEYGIELVTQDDGIPHACKNQINKTDYTFMRELSYESGYDFYMDGARLWFVPIGVQQTDRTFDDLPSSDVRDFNARQVERSTLTASLTGIDIDTKKSYTISSKGSSDIDIFLGNKEFETLSARDLSNQHSEDKVKYVVDSPIPRNRDLIGKMLESLNEDSRFIIEATLSTNYGIGIKPRDIISVVGFGRWGGKYMVTGVSHRISNGAETVLQLARTYSGSFTSLLYKKANVTRSFSGKEVASLPIENTVRVP